MLPLLAALAPMLAGGGAASGGALGMGGMGAGAGSLFGSMPEAAGDGSQIMSKLKGLFSSGTRQGADFTPEQYAELGLSQQGEAYKTALQQAKLEEARGYQMGQSGTGAGAGGEAMGGLFSQAPPAQLLQLAQGQQQGGPRQANPQMNSYIQSLLGG